MDRKPGDSRRPMSIVTLLFSGVILGFVAGLSFPALFFSKLAYSSSFPVAPDASLVTSPPSIITTPPPAHPRKDASQIWVPTNPRGAESLPPGILAAESDLYQRRLWGDPKEDLTSRPRYLVAFTVGYRQGDNINAAIKKFSGNFTIILFHYDGQITKWDKFAWSKQAIHISVPKQTKWWYAKRFLHPDIVAPYDYIFLWDEDIGVEHFDAEEYIRLVRKHGLEVSQPAVEQHGWVVWNITERRNNSEVHREGTESPGTCSSPRMPPCAGFVEIMVPVFSRTAWRCIWYMIQNDLVHGWGIDFALRKCVPDAHEKVGVVDAQWVVHQHLPTLATQGRKEENEGGAGGGKAVYERCHKEWEMFNQRLQAAEEYALPSSSGVK
ncbi:hypothetical protein MLD38_002342 [Melastoma candidum]|uniref:Uncharacterized protein n=1 Tax=Melastoma candidum TaxID=119954 RepID=A0ACB9S2S5_9MYRT|nr:hypothetical protein MLD38_002342 [Melastoma candidum]